MFEGQAGPKPSSSAETSHASQSRLKRPLSNECEGCDSSESDESCQQMEISGEEGLVNKRPRDSNDVSTSYACKRHDMNFPLPNEGGVAAIVKVS